MAEIRHGRYPISDLTKTSTAYLRPSPVAAGKVALNMFKAFVDGLTDNDEKVASSKKHTLCRTKKAKITKTDILFPTETTENPFPLEPDILI